MWRVKWWRWRNVSPQMLHWSAALIEEAAVNELRIDFLVKVSEFIEWDEWWRRVAWWTRIWWTKSLVKRKCIEHRAHQFDALAKAVNEFVCVNWFRWVSHGLIVVDDAFSDVEQVFVPDWVRLVWRTLAIPNGNEVESDRNTLAKTCCTSSSSMKRKCFAFTREENCHFIATLLKRNQPSNNRDDKANWVFCATVCR